jgi:hypothetical protein
MEAKNEEVVMTYFQEMSHYSPEVTEYNHKNSQSVQSVPLPRFEQENSKRKSEAVQPELTRSKRKNSEIFCQARIQVRERVYRAAAQKRAFVNSPIA